jgi:hypothetical protein
MKEKQLCEHPCEKKERGEREREREREVKE